MQNPRLASRYAKSLIDLSIELNQLEMVHEDIMLLEKICKQNKDFVNLLRSPIIKPDKKNKIFIAILGDKIGVLAEKFCRLLIEKGREEFLPEIAHAFIMQYEFIKHISRVKITSAVPLSEEMQAGITQKIKTTTPLQHIQLETAVNKDLIGGFVLEMEDKLVDASILRDLKDIKKQFLDNIYVQNIR